MILSTKFKISTILLFLLIVSNIYAQRADEFKELFHEAEFAFFSEENYERALPIFLMLAEMEETNANVKYYIASCYLHMMGQKSKAIPYLEDAVQKATDNYVYGYKEKRAPMDTYFYLAHAYHVIERLDDAIKVYNEYLNRLRVEDYLMVDFIDQQIKACEVAKKFRKEPIKYRKIHLNENINQYPFNFAPAISGDGTSMVYTSKLGGSNHVFMSKKVSDDWGDPEDISSQLGLFGDAISSSLSYDATKLYVVIQDQFQSNIYESEWVNGKWNKLKKLGRNINTKYWESGGAQSPDGKTFYFSSNRKGGHGELDLYVSELDDKGNWGHAINLGPEINSPFHDDSPIPGIDGNTLYFSSQGHYNMGGFDLFISTRNDAGKWSLPINLGFPINSTDDDMSVAPIGTGDILCYSPIVQEENVRQEISFMALDVMGTKGPTTISGNISTDDNFPELADGFIKVVEASSGDTIKVVEVDFETGEYTLTMLEGNYSFVFSGDGYELSERQVVIPRNMSVPEINLNQELKADMVGEDDYLLIKNILFDFNESTLNNEAKIELERIIDIMKQHPELEFDIEGHTDIIGSAEYNLELSNKRARSVLNYLVKRGLDRSRFRTKGFGEIVAVAVNDEEESEDNPDARRLNRRVEFKVLKSEGEVVIENNVYIPNLLKDSKSLKYTVVVMKVREKLPEDFFDQFDMKELEFVREEKTEDGFIYTIGVFLQKNEAFRVTGDLRKVGLSEAKVVDQHELSELVAAEGSSSRVLFGQPETTQELPVYTIQIMALKKLIDTDKTKKYKGAKAYKSKGGFYRYAIGEYKGYMKAKTALKELQRKGHKDAFIRRLSDYDDM
ncbi:MAG: OmpA family protein [Bacteroidota bacterium]|nr:OmpA family protein [Bacteroidota bacterium]